MKMKMAAPVLLLLLSFTFVLSDSETATDKLKPRALDSFTVNNIQNYGNCTYLVVIKTSCDSTKITRDEIGIAFGDADGNQVYAPRLDDPFTKTFQGCSSDGFQIDGPCASDICYVYLHRTGPDGWMPESVKIFAPNSNPVTYDFNSSSPTPNKTWYGLNLCQFGAPPPPQYYQPPPPSPSYHQPPPPPPSYFQPPPPTPPSPSSSPQLLGASGLLVLLILGLITCALF